MKILNKIVPLVAAGLLVGMTCAMAADLSTWKSDFNNGAVVVGASAATQDILAATDIAGVLGIQAIPTGGASAYLMAAPGDNKLHYGDDWFDVKTVLHDTELASLLKDGKFKESTGATDNDVTYTQTLSFTNGGGDRLVFDALSDSPETAATYLKLTDGVEAYTYDLKFDDAVKFTATEANVPDDFSMAKLTILGKEYTITNAVSVADVITELDLMGGSVEATQGEYTTATYTVNGKPYEVKVIIISDTDSTVKFEINGETTDTLAAGDTDELSDGTVIGVKDVMPNEGSEAAGADQVTFYIGADKLVLSDDGGHDTAVSLNGVDVDGSAVTITSAADELTALKIEYAPEDDVFIAAGTSWTDPVFGRFRFDFKDLTKKTEQVKISTGTDKGTLKAIDIAGNNLEIPMVDDDADVFWGKDLVDAHVYTSQGGGAAHVSGGDLLIDNADFVCADGDNFAAGDFDNALDKIKFVAVSASGEARVIEVTHINAGDHVMTLKDLTTPNGPTWENKDYDAGVGIDLGFTTIHLAVVDDEATSSLCGDGSDDYSITATKINSYVNGLMVGETFETSLGGVLALDQAGDELGIEMFEGKTGATVGSIDVDDNGDGDMIVNTVVGVQNGALIPLKEDSDTTVGVDTLNWGALWTYDNSDSHNSATIDYPEEQVIGNTYITELGGAAAGTSKTYYTDAEATTTFAGKPVIAVGGSAINKISAKLLGLSEGTYGAAWTTATGVGAGQGIIKYIASPTVGSVAMLVAGYEAADTGVLGTMLKEGTPVLSGTSVLIDSKKLITA